MPLHSVYLTIALLSSATALAGHQTDVDPYLQEAIDNACWYSNPVIRELSPSGKPIGYPKPPSGNTTLLGRVTRYQTVDSKQVPYTVLIARDETGLHRVHPNMLARPYETKDLLSAPCESRRDRPSAAQRSGLSPTPPGPVEPPSAVCAFPFHETVGTSLVRQWPESGITDDRFYWVVGTYRQADGSAQYLIKDRSERLRALNASWFTPQRVRELDRKGCDRSRSAAMLTELRKGTAAAATSVLKSQPTSEPSAETLELLLTNQQLARQPD